MYYYTRFFVLIVSDTSVMLASCSYVLFAICTDSRLVVKIWSVAYILYQGNKIVRGACVYILNFAFVRCVMLSVCFGILSYVWTIYAVGIISFVGPTERVIINVCFVVVAGILDLTR